MMCIWMTEQGAEVYATSPNIPSAILELKYLLWTIIQLLCEDGVDMVRKGRV